MDFERPEHLVDGLTGLYSWVVDLRGALQPNDPAETLLHDTSVARCKPWLCKVQKQRNWRQRALDLAQAGFCSTVRYSAWQKMRSSGPKFNFAQASVVRPCKNSALSAKMSDCRVAWQISGDLGHALQL